jgi:hypothetical protein
MFKSIWQLGDKQFRRTKKALDTIASWVVEQWYERLEAKVSPRWWGRMAAENGSIKKVKTPYGIKIFYTSSSEYDYMDVVENGRGAYPILQAFARSDRRKQKKNGGWYITIPFTTNKEPDEDGKKKSSIVNPQNNNINAIIKKVGEYKDDSGQIRAINEYSQGRGTTGRGNVFKSPQKTKGGKITYSYMKFVTASDTSSGWMYPAIPAHKIAEKLEKEAEKMMTGAAFRQAVERDTETYIKDGLRNMGIK